MDIRFIPEIPASLAAAASEARKVLDKIDREKGLERQAAADKAMAQASLRETKKTIGDLRTALVLGEPSADAKKIAELDRTAVRLAAEIESADEIAAAVAQRHQTHAAAVHAACLSLRKELTVFQSLLANLARQAACAMIAGDGCNVADFSEICAAFDAISCGSLYLRRISSAIDIGDPVRPALYLLDQGRMILAGKAGTGAEGFRDFQHSWCERSEFAELAKATASIYAVEKRLGKLDQGFLDAGLAAEVARQAAARAASFGTPGVTHISDLPRPPVAAAQSGAGEIR